MGRRKNKRELEPEAEAEEEEPVEHSDDDEGMEMDAEMSGDEEEDDEEDDDGEAPSDRVPTMTENPFLDSFYGLSSENPRDRSKAAQVMLHHCLLSSNANSKDAAYALRRLLNGVCSGRASARQGNASALASFLKLAFRLTKMEEICAESDADGVEPSNLLGTIRNRLISATDPNQITGKKKGSEERDYQFGRLFGILAIVRSGILISGEDDSREVTVALASDLAKLFWLKRWMREPAAHGITTLLKLFYDNKSNEQSKNTIKKLVEDVVIPKLLRRTGTGEEVHSSSSALFENYCAEQIGIALFIQSNEHAASKKMPFPLNESVLSVETCPLIAKALSETSSVVQPRMHFVWDALWSYLTEPESQQATKRSNKSPSRRTLRLTSPCSDERTANVLDMIIRNVVMEKMLHIGIDKDVSSGKATHERRALALSVVKILCGVAFVSTISGPTKLVLDSNILEISVLSPEIVRSLFLDIICAGSEKKQASHLLKPLALEVLSSITVSVLEDSPDSEARRLSTVKALLNCEPRFDARTKTSTVADLIGHRQPIVEGKPKPAFTFWQKYFDYVEAAFLSESSVTLEGESHARATGYAELLASGAKLVLRVEMDDESQKMELKKSKNEIVQRILALFMTLAFFNCSEVKGVEGSKGKKTKGRKSKELPSNTMLLTAMKVQALYKEGKEVPFPVRSIVSARFFSLLADFCGYSHINKEETTATVEKDAMSLEILMSLRDNWQALEKLGAKRFTSPSMDEEDAVDPNELVSEMYSLVKSSSKAAADSSDLHLESKKRCFTGVAVLAFSLYIHRLSCGQDDIENEDPDADDENDEEEICNALEGLKSVVEGFSDDIDEDSNPLLGLAEICANILSSPLGSGNMGRAASPKLIREAVKYAWLGGLRLASSLASVDRTLLDENVVQILLQAIGADPVEEPVDGSMSDNEGDDEEDEDNSEEGEDSGEENVFVQAGTTLQDDEMMDVDKEDGDADEDEDIELDPSKLQSLLEEDSDASVDDNILEHHEGADAALTKLIKLRQEARKAGREAREKIETSHQLRCTFLLELLLSRSDPWKNIFRGEVLQNMILPILSQRRSVEKSLKKSVDGGAKAGNGDKQALLEKLTSLLKQRICKMRLNSLPLGAPISTEIAKALATKVLVEARRADTKDHASCCSSCFVFVMRSVSDAASAQDVASVCCDAVDEWSKKRTTKLQANLFEDIIAQTPDLALAVLAPSLCKATQNARSPFLKGEAFRLLWLLLGVKPSGEDNAFGLAAAKSLVAIRGDFLSAVEGTLEDKEMMKAKRVRSVLKALEKFIATLSPPATSETIASLNGVAKLLDQLEGAESQGVQAICTKLKSEIASKVTELKSEDSQEQKGNVGSAGHKEKSSSKKKKKKKR